MGNAYAGYGYTKALKEKNKQKTHNAYATQNKNNGGLLGGLGYVGGSIAAGVGGIGEGILDLGAAGIALLGGDTEYAKYVFKDNVVGDWHQSLTEDYNPGKVMQFIGDVGSGLGQSATMLIPYVGVPAFFLGVGSQGISGAAEKTGDVGWKELGYGVTSGIVEGGLEWALGAAGQGAKSIASAIAKSGGKKAAKTVLGRAVRQGLAGKILSSAAGEFLEEAASEVVDVGLQRLYRIDPNASTSLKDVLYAGIVGAVSGGIMGGSVNVVQTLNNRATGRKIVQDGNAQTLINTASLVADKLAGQGTNFRKAPEWVKTLRGEIDAYNKLVKKGKQNGARGETILGEMQASLFFAETQAIASGLSHSIQQSSEENRATLAEYVNKTIPKDKRLREYTAEDIAKDTDGITMQLAVLQFAGNEFINYADAIASLEADQAQEGAIGDVVGEMQQESAEEPSPSTVSTPLPEGEAVQGKAVQGVNEAKYSIKKDSSGNSYVDIDETIVSDSDSPKQIVKTLADVVRTKFTDFVNVKGQKIGINQKTANEWVKSKSADTLRKYDSEKFIDKANAFGNADELLQVARDYIGEERKHQRKDAFVEFARGVVDFKVGNNGYSADIIVGTTKSGAAVLYDIVNVQGKKITADTSYTAQDRRSNVSTVINNSIPQNKPAVNTSGEKDLANPLEGSKYSVATAKRARAKIKENEAKAEKLRQKSTEQVDKAVENKVEEKSAERKNEPSPSPSSDGATSLQQKPSPSPDGATSPEVEGNNEPKIRKPKEILTDEQRAERAKENARRLIEYEATVKVTSKELNTAREYIKDFDNLPKGARQAVIKMIRSADGKVDKKILAGVANLMTIRRRDGSLVIPDLEFRFAEGIGDNGLYTHIGEGENRRVLILINRTDSFKDTIRGTIAHEVVHYIENRKGYRELAEYVMKTARPKKIAEIEAEYNEHYKGIYTAEAEKAGLTREAITKKVAERMATEDHKELIKSEVVAKLIGLRLNNEKFLKKYATKDDAMIKKILRYLKATVTHLKDKDKATAAEVRELVLKFDEVIKGNVTSESEGTKTAKSDETNLKVKAFSEVAVSTALYDALDHNDLGYDNLILMSKMPRFIENNFGISGDLYVYRDHLYENTVSKERALEEGRPTIVGQKNRHFHNLGEERMIEAIMSINSPIMSVEVHSKNNNPTVIMALPVLDDNGSPLRAVLSFYSNQNINGSFDRKPHIVLTITPSQMSESSGARQGWAEFISTAVEEGRVLSYDKEKGSVLSVIAQQARLGNITEASLTDSIARFKKSVKDFKEKNKINYDLAPKKSVTRTNLEKMQDTGKRDLAPGKKKAKAVDKSKLNENGEVKDEFFVEAVDRMYQQEVKSAQNTAEAYKEGNKILNKKLDAQKKLHADLVAEIIELEDRVHHLENQNEAYKEGNKTVNELLSAARKRRNKAVIELEEVRAELRQMGYDLESERRKVKQREEQIDKQKKMLKDAAREKARLEREFKLLSEVEAREIARLKKQIAKERAEIGKVYSEAEIRREIKTMMESGLISKFFGGQYKPDLPMEKLNLIARYIAIELNTVGTAEGKRANALLEKAADEIVARLKFTDEDSGKKYVIRDLVDAETLEQFMDFAKKDIRDLFNNVGTINAYSELVRQYKLLEQKYNAENDKASEKAAWGKEFPKTYQAAMKVKALAEKNKGAGSDSIQFISKTLASVVDTAGHMNLTKVDEAAKAISDFLDGEIAKEEAERAQLSEGAELTSFSWDTYEMIRSLVNEFIALRENRIGEQLTSEELRVFGEMLRGMKHVIERYNKEFVGSHLVNADTVVTTEITDLLSFASKNKEYKTKVGKFLGEKLGKTLNQLYFYNVLSPETVIEAVEGFKKDGLLKTLLHSIREAEQSSRTMAARMKDPFVQFMDNKENVWTDEKGRKHSFRNKLNNKMIKIKEKEISLGEAIYLYMLTKREHSHLGLKDNGYITYNDDGNVKETIYVLDPQMTRSEIESQLDAKDKEFLKMSEQFFNETASKIKYDADMKLFGFSNNQPSYYVPIIRDRYARMNGVSDPRMGISSIITVYNKSFTQALVRNNNALEGKSIMRIIDDHADGLADYSELYLPLKAFDRLYNRRVILDDGHAMSIRQVLNQKIWNGAEGYLTDLFKDVQGQSRGETKVVDAVAGWLRSGWVNSLLGANLKVVVTQTTSLAAATQVIEGKYITSALSTITPGKDVSEIGARADKYSKIIFARHFEMGALKSQGNIDKVTEIGKKTGALIEWMDRRVCLAIFHAAELKAEALGHGAVGTESNAIAAAKIADKAIFTTQAMNGSTERSALQRSKSEISKMFSIFTSDTIKQLSHLYGNTMKYLAHKERAKTDKLYEALLENDKKEMLRSMRTLAIVGVMIGLITQGFKYLYNKEEEEPEDRVKDFVIDVASSTLNILPVWSDVIDKLFLDYDMSVNVLDVANDTLETVSNGFKLAGKVMSGEYVSNKEIGRTAVNIGKSTFSLFGWPVTPVERTVTGLMRRFTPSTIYGYDAMFKNPSYTADLQRAVEKGDERLAEHILGQLYRNEIAGVYTSEELEIVADLYSKGYTNVLPQRVGETINDVKLDKKQRQQFNKIYAQASSKVMEMIATSEFKELSEEQQAKAIKNLYSLYYNRAASTVVGKEVSNAQVYSWLTDNYSVLFTAPAYKGGLEVVKDARGKEISVRDQFVEYVQNLGLSESDAVVIAYANGVRDKATKAAFIEHINSLKLTDEQKATIADKLSLEVKDGKIVEKKE